MYQGNCAAAAAKLDEALRLSVADASLLNDSSVAHLCVAHDSPDSAGASLVVALERALTAAALKPDWPEPFFNLTVAYDEIGLRSLARDALRIEMAREREDGWRQIASRRLQQIDQSSPAVTEFDAEYFRRPTERGEIRSMVESHSQSTRQAVELKVLEAWAEAARINSADEPVLEANLRAFGDARQEVFGDGFMLAVADSIGRPRGRARQALIRAHASYARGRALYDQGERELAGTVFGEARRDFELVGSPFEYEAQLQQGTVLYQLRRLAQARLEIDHVRREAARLHYRTIESRARFLLGLIDMQEGRVESAVRHYQTAIAFYESLRELDNITSVANTAADTLRTAGDRQRGWRLLLRAAQGLPNLNNRQREYLIIFNLSLYAQDEGLLRAADVFQRAAVQSAESRGASLTIIESHLRHAQLALRRDDADTARDALARVAPRIDSLKSAMSAAYLAAWRDRVTADLLARENPRAASAQLEALVDRFETTEPAEIPSILLSASRSAQHAGESVAASRLLHRALDFVDSRRTLLRAPEYRITYMAAMWEIFHDLIGLEFSADPNAALSTAETARRALASEDATGRPGSPVVMPTLADDTAILYYSSLQDRLILWTITSKGTTPSILSYPFDELSADVDAFRRAIESRPLDSPRTELARRLFERVFAAALAGLEPSIRRLLIAADGVIGDLPAAALVDPRTNRFLFERFEIALIPSLGIMSDEPFGSVHTVLSVGFNGKPGTGVPLLAAAEKEAEAVGRIYPDRTFLIGDTATAEAVRSAVANRDVLHIAAHARANRLLPWKSQLSLAPLAGSEGSLDFEAVSTWDLRRCALVVLSACETATGARLRGQGVISLAYPFLSAGAKAVVGTLWQIDDRGADSFMRLFHKYVSENQPAARAMTLAQRDAILSPDPVLRSARVWAGYVVNTRIWDARAQKLPNGQSIPGETRKAPSQYIDMRFDSSMPLKTPSK